MNTILRFLEVFALGTWLGGILYLSFAVAPGAFGTLGSRDQAGALVGLVLGRLHIFGVIAGIVYLVAALVLARSLAALARPAALAVILMVVLTAASQWGVSSRMAALRTEMGSVDRTPVESPLRAEFDRLHKISVRLEGSILLLGIAALFLTVREHR
jgi:uncharacterized membrane protein